MKKYLELSMRVFKVLFLSMICYTCSDSGSSAVNDQLPTVETMEVINIERSSAEAHGKVTDSGGLPIDERGLAWDTLSEPEIDRNSHMQASAVTVTGKFSVTLSNLKDSTQYYVRAYAKNSEGISYGNEVSFVTKANASNEDGGPTKVKKGVPITTKGAVWTERINALNVGSHYSWGNELKEDEPADVEFVPMIWGWWGDEENLQDRISYVNSLARAGKVHYLLGFNEPDKDNQANMPVERAIRAWPILMDAEVPLGSPAPANPTGQWLQNFMAEVNEKGYRVDFITVHSYGGINAKAFLNKLERIHNMYNRPIWITEWAVADWGANSPEDNQYIPEQVKTYMGKVLPRLEELDYVERYYWYPSGTQHNALAPSALFKGSTAELTELGKFYRDFKSGPSNR